MQTFHYPVRTTTECCREEIHLVSPNSIVDIHSHTNTPSMGTMKASKHVIEEPSSENAKTRPRPPPVADADALSMEAIHAEFLDNYHREAHRESEEEGDEVIISTSTADEENDDGSCLSETPNTVTGELSASLGIIPPVRQRKKDLHRTESNDRNLKETARFFQAVGETPPTSEIDIQTIIEDDHNSDSDSDEDDTGTVHVVDESEAENFDLSFDVHQPFRTVDSVKTTPLKKLHLGGLTKKSQHLVPPRKLQSIFHRLPSGNLLDIDEFQYKGIQNPPEITQHGFSRGNYALLHRKAWLEVSDERHRYGKNLRLYYRHWASLGHPSNDFFDWLDSKGETAGKPLPELAECPRSELDSDTVLYIKDSEVTKRYALSLVCDREGRTRVFDTDDEPVCTGSDGYIFVLRDNVLYGAEKVTSVSEHSRQRFHHSSFFGGKAVAAAGIFITDQDGYLIRVLPHSGHYRPGEADMQRMVFFLYSEGVDLRSIEVDTQQLNHINRKDPNTFRKKAKKDSLHLTSALSVANFLSHKARFIGQGIFSQVHQMRNLKHTSVKEALHKIDSAEEEIREID
eukprot:scaffold1248_cov170-Amphora_coffeaeformis.AAC.17